MAENKEKMFLHVLESDNPKIPVGCMVEVELQDGQPRIISEPMPFPDNVKNEGK